MAGPPAQEEDLKLTGATQTRYQTSPRGPVRPVRLITSIPFYPNAYLALIAEALADDLLASIRLHLQQQRALGHDAFRAMVEAKTHRFAGVRPTHRPCKPSTVN
ncbi:hypothetical protein VC273_06030 [Xanthomonas nasturtii]|uniref:hypothetical protein n=1 Tax=Xanthomonas TaxID=338 RepID=UPI002B222B7C|nr:hypothetical protein [Xanthomonas nasturtii]MEA9555495.1 hypothetical protein [Xanthomonas nasturtii]